MYISAGIALDDRSRYHGTESSFAYQGAGEGVIT